MHASNTFTELIDLGIGHLEDAQLPLADLKQAAMGRFSAMDKSCLQYGPEEGSESFRIQLGVFLSRHYGFEVRPENLLITAGASHGLDLILSKLSQPGETIVVENPSYFFALDILRERQINIVGVPVDEQGIDVNALERLLEVERPSFLYTIPVFHNPTGMTLSTERRERLIHLARKHGFLIIADEVYHLLAEPREIPRALVSMAPDIVLSLGSFSKILGPGLRLGWIHCDPSYMASFIQSGVLRSGGGVNPFAAAIVESAIELGIQDEYLITVRSLCNTRRLHMTSLLKQLLPTSATFLDPQGGFFVWLELPDNINADDLNKEALAMNISFRPGTLFSYDGRYRNCLRICFTFYNEERLEFACTQLGRLLHRYM